MQFKITFGMKYKREEHTVLGLRPELVDGWLTIEADDERVARHAINALIGSEYAFLYGPDYDLSRHHPLGDLGSLEDAVAAATVTDAWVVGLPVWVDRQGRLTVDLGDLEVALREQDVPESVLSKVGHVSKGTPHIVIFPHQYDDAPRCLGCGAPEFRYSVPTGDGDTEPRTQCQNRACGFHPY